MKDKYIIISLILVLILGIGGFYYMKNRNNSSNNSLSSASSSINIDNSDKNIDWASYDSNDIILEKSTKITEAGVYNLTGTISDGYIEIDTDGEVELNLNNVSITNTSGPAIYVKNANTVVINLSGENTLTDGSTYNFSDTDANAVIFSHDNLVIMGSGTLKINANYEDGIVSKDDLKIKSGIYIITSKDDGIRGKDSVYIINGKFTINSGGDAIKSTNDTDSEKGFVKISKGTFNITSSSDGIDALTKLIIDGGTFIINSQDDGTHADGLVEINGGTITISACEGIEGTYVKINDGSINISASDDGINATNKSDNYQVTIEINGGNIIIKMGSGDTDGIDANGNLYINGGTINITGQSPFDYDGEAKYTGGKIIVNGVETNEITNQFMGGGMNNRVMQGNGDMNSGMMLAIKDKIE